MSIPVRAAAMALLVLGGLAQAAEQSLPGAKLLVQDPSGNPALRKVLLQAKGPGALPLGDPTIAGAGLRIVTQGGTPADQAFDLPSAGWKRLGTTGFKYGAGATGGAVRTVLLKRGANGVVTLKVLVQGRRSARRRPARARRRGRRGARDRHDRRVLRLVRRHRWGRRADGRRAHVARPARQPGRVSAAAHHDDQQRAADDVDLRHHVDHDGDDHAIAASEFTVTNGATCNGSYRWRQAHDQDDPHAANFWWKTRSLRGVAPDLLGALPTS